MKTWMGVVAIWLWCATIVAPQGSASPDEYILNLIKDVRKQAIYFSKDTRYGIPVLPDPSTNTITITNEERYMEIEIPNESKYINIGIDITSMSMMGYKSHGDSYFFKDTPNYPFNYFFPSTRKHHLSFNLEDVAPQILPNITLGILELYQAVTFLSQSDIISQQVQAWSLVVIDQVILQAIKLRYVEHLVQNSIIGDNKSFQVDPAVLSLEDQWSNLSNAIQQSNRGIFSKPVDLKRSDGSDFKVDTVSGVIVSHLAVMLYVCNEDQDALLIRSVVAENTCQVPEPTVLIVGENNLCVTVDSSSSRPILTQCISVGNSKTWKFRSDKKIEYTSEKICLGNKDSSGDDLRLYDCDSPNANVNWNLRGDGSITIPGSQRAWDIMKEYPFVSLSDVSYSKSQAWLGTNYSTPFLTYISIEGHKFCMGTDESGRISLSPCSAGKEWRIFADGSIRPEINNLSCITCLGDAQESSVAVRTCTRGSTNQRWLFQNNGSIKNLKNGFVISATHDGIFVISKDEGDSLLRRWLPLI